MLKPLCLLLFLLPLCASANPTEADRIKRRFELSADKWRLEMKLATTEEARQQLAENRPDPVAAANEIWANIGPNLTKDWTIPYAAFFLNITRDLNSQSPGGKPTPALRPQRDEVLRVFAETHLQAAGIEPLVIAIIDSGEPQALALLEKIAKEHPEDSTKGIAALGAALLLKGLGDEPEVMSKRLSYLREAIIKSADREIGSKSVADIASDELYLIRYLSKGRTAPALSGMDVGARPVKLSDFKGRIVVLLFWDAKTVATDKIIQLTNQLVSQFKDKPVTVLGVTPEAADRIRTLQADGSIMWNNISDSTEKLAAEYRISSRPAVFVIDAEGVIQYTGLPGSFVELTVDALLNPDRK